MLIEVVSFFILLSAIGAIYSKYQKSTKTYGILKGITTLLILLLAIFIYQEQQNAYSLLMIISILFSLVGDLFLIGEKHFLHGLLAFLMAHIGFTIGFTSVSGFYDNLIPLIILLLISGIYFIYLRKYLYKYAIPVAVYLVAIVIMNWQALGLVLNDYKIHFLGIAIASLLFSFSDSIIAYNKFKKPFKLAEFLILSTYWLALYVFVISGLNIS